MFNRKLHPMKQKALRIENVVRFEMTHLSGKTHKCVRKVSLRYPLSGNACEAGIKSVSLLTLVLLCVTIFYDTIERKK